MRKYVSVLGYIAAVLLLVLAVGVTVLYWKDELTAAKAQILSQATKPETTLLVNLNREADKLIGVPRGYTPTVVKASTVVAAIRRGDFAYAEKAVKQNLLQSRIQNWHFRPFSKFIVHVSQRGDEDFLDQLTKWVDHDKNSAIPHLLRAQYHQKTAWLLRGEDFASEVQTGRMSLFRTHIERAATDIAEAIRLDETNPYSLYLWLEILSGYGNTPGMETAFRQSIRKFPNYYPLYLVRLETLSPKWGGSPKEMYAFVDNYAGKANAYPPLKMLYVQLYADLLEIAWIPCKNHTNDALAQCIASAMDRFVTRNLIKNVYKALQLYDHVDKYEFTSEVGSILNDMVRTRGAERFAGIVLQLAANSMGSDTQLSANDTSKNNFMIDHLTGYVWFRKDRPENAEKLFIRAIDDLPNIRFPDEEERDGALAELYDKLAGVYNETREYEKVVAYQKAADTLGGIIRPGWSHIKCHALYRLKLYGEAIQDCTLQFEKGGNVEAVFWRAKAHDALGNIEEALHDYRLVADSEHDFRISSAIEISVIYARSNDMPHMLETLNTYDFLYDETYENKKDIAIAYNNRCYANMHLGNLQDALNDCTASLRFDSLPDAFQKQQELIKRLQAKEVGV